jgi:arginase
MPTPSLHSVTVIFSPYHVGIRDHAVGAGPGCIREKGLLFQLQELGVAVHELEIGPVDGFDGDIGRSFEVFRRTARLVTAARDAGSFPIIVSGNCGASVGVLAGVSKSRGLKEEELGCVWFDAHDDFNVPDTVLSGYFDSMGIAIMAGQCWKALSKTIPGYKPLNLKKFVHCGLRDLNDIERSRVAEAGYPVIWGNTESHVDFKAELEKELDKRSIDPAMIHVDLDCLDSTVGQVNKFEPAPGGLSEDDLIGCLKMLPAKVDAVSLTIASFDPVYDKNDKIAGIAIRGVVSFVRSLLDSGILVASNA